MNYYRKCFVPTCKNDSTNSPNKMFVRIREDLREKWCREVKAEYFKVYTMYCCEDHFDPEEDLKNYYKHKLMQEEPAFKPTAKLRNIDILLNISHQPKTECSELCKILQDKSIPVKKRKFEETVVSEHSVPLTSMSTKVPAPGVVHVGTQCIVQMRDKSTSFKGRKIVTHHTKREIQSSQEFSSETTSATPSLFGFTSETEETSTENPKKDIIRNRDMILATIKKKPKMYLGVPKQFLWLLDYIVQKSTHKIDSLCLVVTLFKLKQNDSIERISDHFELSRTKLSVMILQGIEILATYFQNLIFHPEPIQIKRNLPLVFKIRYSNVQMIIDCFEIQITKPSDPQKQAQTWSQYKNCNTVKYLIGCTPNGLVSFISEGYGGRISDKAIVEKSNLVDVLPSNAIVLADRGFKEVESLFSSHGIKLLRPPSVYTGIKQSHTEALQSKVIASLRVHIERVIRRIREFALLKPHSVVNYKYVPYLDELVIIACGLINLQGEIIKFLKENYILFYPYIQY